MYNMIQFDSRIRSFISQNRGINANQLMNKLWSQRLYIGINVLLQFIHLYPRN